MEEDGCSDGKAHGLDVSFRVSYLVVGQEKLSSKKDVHTTVISVGLLWGLVRPPRDELPLAVIVVHRLQEALESCQDGHA